MGQTFVAFSEYLNFNIVKVCIFKVVIYYECNFLSWTSQSSLFGEFAVLQAPTKKWSDVQLTKVQS